MKTAKGIFCALTYIAVPGAMSQPPVRIQFQGPNTVLSTDGEGSFHLTLNRVFDLTTFTSFGTKQTVITWKEEKDDLSVIAFYAVSDEAGAFVLVREILYHLKTGTISFDPLDTLPALRPDLESNEGSRLCLIQLVSPPIPSFLDALRQTGVKLHSYVPNHAYLATVQPNQRAAVGNLPFVRWTGSYHPAYRLESFLRANLDHLNEVFPLATYLVQVVENTPRVKQAVAQGITGAGGTIDAIDADSYLLKVRLTPEQLVSVAHLDEVAYIFRWKPAQLFMDVAREFSGANYLESIAGYTGQGVIGEAFDAGLLISHDAFTGDCQEGPHDGEKCRHDADCNGYTCVGGPILHGLNYANPFHGTEVYGVLFGDPRADAMTPFPHPDNEPQDARGILPDAQGVFATFTRLEDMGLCEADCTTRTQHTCELVNANCCQFPEEQPYCPYNAVFQSNSWGPVDFNYSGLSVQIDAILFWFDLSMCQAQANFGHLGNNLSAAAAWAKNVVSVGGFYHKNTEQRTDDHWTPPLEGASTGSQGPRNDGAVKPDLAHFYDAIYTASSEGEDFYRDNTNPFGGTSAATPITCGYFGLFYQMWAEDADGDGKNIFGYPVAPCDAQIENCVFARRPHMTTAKAMMINTAEPYCWDGCPSTNPDMTRMRQGWGTVSVKNVYDRRDTFFIIDETDVIQFPLRARYSVVPVPGANLRVTLTYADPYGTPPNFEVNDLDLKVTSPSGTVYWGNCGLKFGMWSSQCPGPNRPDYPNSTTIVRDTVENVFIETPEPGTWIIEVFAAQIYQDGHVVYVNDDPSVCASGGLPEECIVPSPFDTDFALVASSVRPDCNGNAIADAQDVATGTSQDCNSNDIPDECDIATLDSVDCNANSVPDECELYPPTVPPDITEPGFVKNRYLTVIPQNAGAQTALRVTFFSTSLTGTGFAGALGRSWWVGQPKRSCENSGQQDVPQPNNPPYYGCATTGTATVPRTFMVASLLQVEPCTPYYADWSEILSGEPLNLVGQAVVPGSTYEIRAIPSACDTEEESNYSSPLFIATAEWCDIVGNCTVSPCTPPNGTCEGNDIVCLLDKFQNKTNAPIKSRTDVDPATPDRLILISDIQNCQDAFGGDPYPFDPPTACGSGGGGGGGGSEN